MRFRITLDCPYCTNTAVADGVMIDDLYFAVEPNRRSEFFAAETAPFAEGLAQEVARHLEEFHAPSGLLGRPA